MRIPVYQPRGIEEQLRQGETVGLLGLIKQTRPQEGKTWRPWYLPIAVRISMHSKYRSGGLYWST